MKRKAICKAIVAIAVALAFVLPGAAAFANFGTIGVTFNMEDTGDMENMVEDQSPKTMLSVVNTPQPQQTNTFDPDWIHFDDGTNVNSIGLTDGGTFEFGIRITPTELAGYDTWLLTTVKWHHGMAGNPQPPHSGTIKIYDAGTSSSPGALLTSEAFTTAASSDWEETTLSDPATIDASKDIWVTIQVTHAVGEYPAGVGPGPVVPGKGGWITTDGTTWQQLGIDIPSLNYNWNIWAEVKVGSEPPEKPQRPEGPTRGKPGVEYTYTTTTTDPDGDQVYYKWDWDDGSYSDWLGPYNSGTTATGSHSWSVLGTYDIKVKAKDIHGAQSDWSDALTISIVENEPPNIPTIAGQIAGKPDVTYLYTFVTTDPDGDDVYYYVDWGDDTFEEWLGPFDSGDTASATHSWTQGTYTIKVKAKDTLDDESEWGTLDVTMPVNYQRSQQSSTPLFFQILQRLLTTR